MRSKKALYNIIAQMTYEIVAMICGLILPRLILSAFGSSYNGLISSITQFLDYISILTLGISGSTRVAIYKANANGNINDVSAVLKATEIYMRKVAIAFIVYMVALTFIYPLIVSGEFEWIDVASLVVIIGIGTFAEYFFGITYKTFLMANQSMYIYNIIQIGSKIVSTLVAVLLIKLGQNIQIVKLGSAICFAVTPIILNQVVRRKYGIIKNIKPDNSALKQRKDVMAHSVANCVHQYTDVFLLTIFTSSNIVSVYSVYNLVLSSLNKLQTVFTTGLEAAFGELWAKGEIGKFEYNFNIFEYLIFAFISVIFSCAVLLILPFVQLYTKGVTDTEYIIPIFAYLYVAAYAALSLRTPYVIAVQAAGKYKETKIGAFIEAGLNFGISIICVIKLGLVGVVIGTLVANTFRTIQYAIFISKKLLVERTIFIFLKRIIWLVLNMSIIITLKLLLPTFEIDNWLMWIISGLFYFVAAVIIVLCSSLIFYRNDLKSSILVFKNMIKKRKNKEVKYDKC
jgi:O-antigen/teichoic acid export membrane protein